MKSALIAILLLMCAYKATGQGFVCPPEKNPAARAGLDYLRSLDVKVLTAPGSNSCCEAGSIDGLRLKEKRLQQTASDGIEYWVLAEVEAVYALLESKRLAEKADLSAAPSAASVLVVLQDPRLEKLWNLFNGQADSPDASPAENVADQLTEALSKCWPRIAEVRSDLLEKFCQPLQINSKTKKISPVSYEPQRVTCDTLLTECDGYFRLASIFHKGQEIIASRVSMIPDQSILSLQEKSDEFYSAIQQHVTSRLFNPEEREVLPPASRLCINVAANRNSGLAQGLHSFYVERNDFIESLTAFLESPPSLEDTKQSNVHSLAKKHLQRLSKSSRSRNN